MHASVALAALLWSVSLSAATAPPPVKVVVPGTVPTTEALARTPFFAQVDPLEKYVVPDGQIVVLQTVSVRRTCPTIASNVGSLFVLPGGNPAIAFEINIPLTFGFTNGVTSQMYVGMQNVSIYLEPGTEVGVFGGAGGNCEGG